MESNIKFQSSILRDVVADYAYTIIDKYRAGKMHGREVAGILGPIFEAANDTFERDALPQINFKQSGSGILA